TPSHRRRTVLASPARSIKPGAAGALPATPPNASGYPPSPPTSASLCDARSSCSPWPETPTTTPNVPRRTPKLAWNWPNSSAAEPLPCHPLPPLHSVLPSAASYLRLAPRASTATTDCDLVVGSGWRGLVLGWFV